MICEEGLGRQYSASKFSSARKSVWLGWQCDIGNFGSRVLFYIDMNWRNGSMHTLHSYDSED